MPFGHFLQYILIYIDGVLILSTVQLYVQRWRLDTFCSTFLYTYIDGVLIVATVQYSLLFRDGVGRSLEKTQDEGVRL
jgi:hypothetical protein